MKEEKRRSLHTQFLAVLLGSAACLAVVLTLLYLSINYLSLMSQFARENELRLRKLEKILSVPYLKQDYVMIVDIIDAEVKSGSLDYIWVIDRGLVIACNAEDQVMHPLDLQYVSRPGFQSLTTPDGFSIAMLPNYAIIHIISLRVFIGAVITVLAVLSIALVLASRLSHRISDPIAKAVAASHRIASGDFELSFEKTTITEINLLLTSLTDTGEKLKGLTESLASEKVRLQESEEKYRRLVENLPDTYFFFSFAPDGRIIYLSPSVRNVLGYPPEEHRVISRHLISEKIITGAFLVAQGEKQKPHEIEVPHADGGTRTLEVLEVPVFGTRNNITLIEGIARDITLEKRAEMELIQAQKMETIGSLAGGIAHDFNNILGGMMGTLSVMKHKLATPGGFKDSELEAFLNDMDNACHNATFLVNQILTLSRKQAFHLTIIDLNDTLRYVMKICETTFDRSIRLQTSFHPDKALVLADPVQIDQVLLNICVNAGHAMTIMRRDNDDWGGTLSVSLEMAASSHDLPLGQDHPEGSPFWIVSVTDTGVGMDAKTSGRIFDPFFTTKGKGTGTGLGLAITYNIVKQHKGYIHAYSEPGVGTTMKVYLPVYLGKEQPIVKSTQGSIVHGEGTILVVDDEELIRKTARVMLQECGYQVITADNGMEALEIFRLKHTDITAVLLDMVMPVMSGRETLEEMKRIDPGVKVLLCSGFQKDDRVRKVLALGAGGFIQKPFNLQGLSEAMSRVISGE